MDEDVKSGLLPVDYTLNARRVALISSIFMAVHLVGTAIHYFRDPKAEYLIIAGMISVFCVILVYAYRKAKQGFGVQSATIVLVSGSFAHIGAQLFMQDTSQEWVQKLVLLSLLGVAILTIPPARLGVACVAVIAGHTLIASIDMIVPSFDSGYNPNTRLVTYAILLGITLVVAMRVIRTFPRLPMISKLTATMLAVGLIPAMAIGTTYSAWLTEQLIQHEESRLTILMDRMDGKLNGFFTEYEGFATQAARSPLIVRNLQSGELQQSSIDEELASHMHPDNKDLMSIVLLDPEGEIISTAGMEATERCRDSWRDIFSGGQRDPIWIPPAAEDEYGFAEFFTPIEEESTIHGWLGVCVGSAFLVQELEWLGNLWSEEAAQYLAVDERGDVILQSPGLERLEALPQGFEDALAAPGVIPTFMTPAEDQYMARATTIPLFDWRLLVARPAFDVIGPVVRQVNAATFATSLYAVFAIALAVTLAHIINQPILALRQTAKAWRDGDLSKRADDTRPDEMGQLAGTFNALTAQLQQSLTGLHEQIHELATAHDEVRRHQRERTRIIDGSPIPIAILDPSTGTVVEANEAYARLADCPRSELIGSEARRFAANDTDLLRAIEAYQRLRNGESEIERFDCRVTDYKGRFLELDIVITLLLDDQGAPLYIIVQALDMTAERHHHRLLAERQLERQMIFDHAPYGMAIHDADNAYFIDVNNKYCEDIGYAREDLIGRSISEFTPDESWDNVYQSGHRLFHGLSEFESFEQIIERKGGEFRNWKVALILIRDDQGRPKHYVSQAVDVTEERDGQRRIRESEERLRLIAENTNDMIWLLDGDGRFLYVTPSCKIFHGVEPSELIGQQALDWIHPDDRSTIVDENGKFLPAEHTHLVSYRSLNAQGDPVPAEFKATVIRDPETGRTDRIIGTSRDVRATLAAEKARRDLERQVQHSQKLESLGLMAGGIAHDFNNLLVAILGHANIAQSEVHQDSPVLEHLRNIESASLRASELTTQLLAYSGRGRLSSEFIDLGALIKDMVALLEISVSKHVTLRYQCEAGVVGVQGDPGQIQQIILNLITNASEAIGDQQGEIDVTTSVRTIHEHELARLQFGEGCLPGRYAALVVRDSGVGMDEVTREHMFDPFFTTKHTGRGLGLAAIIGIVRSHNGAIDVQSQVDGGTTFSVLLPATEQFPDKATGSTVPTTKVNDAEGTTILVVDDEALVRNTARAVLERFGYRVVEAENGREAVDYFSQHANEVGGVILDLTMPVMDGADAYHAMLEIDSTVRVLVTSGFDKSDAIAKFDDTPPFGFLQKPYRPTDLTDAVIRMVQS